MDRILYIFGSFTRKKDKRKSVADQNSISAGNSPLRIPRSSSRPISQATSATQGDSICQNLDVAPRTSAYESDEQRDWQCGICKKGLEEPRLLGCLHSFCTRCMQRLHQEGECEAWSEVDAVSTRLDSGESSGSGTGSAGSGYESDLRRSGSEVSWEKPRRAGILTRKISGKHIQFILCPTCGYETQLPLGGIAALPINYVLLRKMADEVEDVSVLCDLCTADNKAKSRCNQCLVSVCSSCGEAHGRHKATARHSLKPLDVTPPTYCQQHPRAELSVYCATCQQVVCRDCCISQHSGHALANAARAAAERARLLRDACSRARRVPQTVEHAVRCLSVHAAQADAQAAAVEEEVQQWAEQYRRAVETHGRALCTAASRARARYRMKVEQQERELEEKSQQAVFAVRFAEELLSEAKEDELLSLSAPVLRRLERLAEVESLAAPPRCDLRFAPTAPVGTDSMLVGRLLTRAPDPEQCVINVEGLQDLRVDCMHQTILELRDSSGERIWCGGEQVAGYFRRRDSSARPMTATVTDCGDGSYNLSFKAPSPGAYLLAVMLNNKPIKGSPFPCAARVSKAHSGQYHCCSFCSSGGKRDVTCGCGSTMGGGYKGCGHGHAGWPGGRHWSCCGSTNKHAICSGTGKTVKERPNTHLYQFSL